MRDARSRRRGARRAFVFLLGVLVALVYTVFTAAFREGPDDAFAAPPKPKTAYDGGPEEAGPDAAALAAVSSDGGKSDGGNEILDMAIAPDGGVPYHVDAGAYRSPFALPAGAATETARAKVAFLLNSVDDYDVKTGTFEADFFISFTSRLPMPDLSLAFANGKIDSKEVIADKPTFKFYRMTGKFKSPPNLRKYPFDSQELGSSSRTTERGSRYGSRARTRSSRCSNRPRPSVA